MLVQFGPSPLFFAASLLKAELAFFTDCNGAQFAMSLTHPSQYAATITSALIAQAVAQAPARQTGELATFTDKFWQGVVADDLVDRNLDQDTQLTWEAWEAFASFDPQRPMVDVAPARYGVE